MRLLHFIDGVDGSSRHFPDSFDRTRLIDCHSGHIGLRDFLDRVVSMHIPLLFVEMLDRILDRGSSLSFLGVVRLRIRHYGVLARISHTRLPIIPIRKRMVLHPLLGHIFDELLIKFRRLDYPSLIL